MAIQVNLHRTHRALADGREAVQVEGATVGECLRQLVQRYPGLRDELFEGPDRLKKNVEIWLNLESAYPDELSRPTADGDQIHVTVLLAGG